MAVVIDGRVYFDGKCIGSVDMADMVINIEYDRPKKYTIGE